MKVTVNRIEETVFIKIKQILISFTFWLTFSGPFKYIS